MVRALDKSDAMLTLSSSL